jgi:hypothetical protein
MPASPSALKGFQSPHANSNVAALLLRIRAEYEDMPGLCLTLRQAARLWDLDVAVCERLLETLVAQGVLRQGRGGYLLARTGARC